MWPSSGSGPNQWSFNPAMYQNIPNEQVDWASLAQQWIKMKETMPNMNQGPPPPPAPTISKPAETIPPKATLTVPESQSNNDIEGGEAPMDMDTKDDEAPASPVGVAPGGNWNQWGNWQSQWGWGWPGNAGTVPLGEKTPSTASTVDSKVKSQSNDSIPVLNNYVSNVGNFPVIGDSSGTSTSQVPSSFNYSNIGGGTIPPVLPKSGYWNESGKSGSENWSKGNKANSSRHASQKSTPNPVEQFLTMDAAKKKQLPAWIREGLNKMEREKQKKLERERMMQEKYSMNQQTSEESSVLEVPAEPVQNLTQFQNFVADEEPMKKSPPPAILRYRQRSRSPSTEPASRQQRSSRPTREDYNAIRKTKDQIMEDSMLKVRRILTEILLEVTENQVQIIAKEEFRRAKSATAQQIRKSSTLTSLTGNLGLNIYDSESESSGSEKEKDGRGFDSDEELRVAIDRKRKEFARIEDEIEQEIEDQEAKERLIARKDANDDDDDDDDDDEDEDEPEHKDIQEKANPEVQRSQNATGGKEIKDAADRATANHKSNDSDGHRNDTRSSQPKSSPGHGGKINGESATDKATSRKRSKRKTRSRSSTSSSSSSSALSSSESSSSDSSSADSDSSSSGDHGAKKRENKPKRLTRRKEETPRESKRSRYRSKSRSTSKSRYSHDKRYKESRSRRPESKDRRRGSPRRRSSPGRHRRSRSRHRGSRDSSISKYRDSRRRDSVDSRRGRHRSSSRESKHSRYKRH